MRKRGVVVKSAGAHSDIGEPSFPAKGAVAPRRGAGSASQQGAATPPPPLDHYGACPACGVAWTGDDIPLDIRHLYSPPYKWSRVIGVEIEGGYDGVSLWRCPDCGAEFDRFPRNAT